MLKPREKLSTLQENQNVNNYNKFIDAEIDTKSVNRPLSQQEVESINVSLVNLEFLKKMPQHYLTITQCQNLLKNIKVLNSITPTLIT